MGAVEVEGMEGMKQAEMRVFGTGATRDSDENKYDFEGFLEPVVLEEFAKYMHKHRRQADGKMRESDNWQKGIPKKAYMKSAWRHFHDWWKQHRGYKGQDALLESLSALIFNAFGYMYEVLRERQTQQTLHLNVDPRETGTIHLYDPNQEYERGGYDEPAAAHFPATRNIRHTTGKTEGLGNFPKGD